MTRGTGRYNVTLGAATTVQGTGAAFSTTLAGFIIVGAGYDRAFLALAAIAAVFLSFFVMSATRPDGKETPEDAVGAAREETALHSPVAPH